MNLFLNSYHMYQFGEQEIIKEFHFSQGHHNRTIILDIYGSGRAFFKNTAVFNKFGTVESESERDITGWMLCFIIANIDVFEWRRLIFSFYLVHGSFFTVWCDQLKMSILWVNDCNRVIWLGNLLLRYFQKPLKIFVAVL